MSWDFKRLEVQENERRRKYLYFIVLTVLTAAFLMVALVINYYNAKKRGY
jgi:hypothetical protein